MMLDAASPNATPASGAESKLAGLELLRFLCAVAVMIFHYWHFSYAGYMPVDFDVQAQPFAGPLKLIYRYGAYGVHVFWCISGFIFYWKYGAPVSDRSVGAWPFFVLRFSRLYPLHLLTLAVVALLQAIYFSAARQYFVYQHNDLYHLVLHLFFASDWGLEKGYSYNRPVWSISIEVIVYLVFFVLLRFLGRSVLVIAAMIAASLAVLVSGISHHDVFSCLLLFYLGGLAAAVYRRTRGDRLLEYFVNAVALAIVAGFLVSEFFFQPHPYRAIVACSPLVILLLAMNVPESGMSPRIFVVAGSMTYASYLLHFPVQLAIATGYKVLQREIPADDPRLFLFYVGATLLLSFFVYRGFELPCQNYIRARYASRTMRSGAGA